MLKLSCTETERLKLAIGTTLLGVACTSLLTGHPVVAGILVGVAAPFLLKPSDGISKHLDLRPSGRVIGALGLTALGWGGEILGARHSHAVAGVVWNGLTNVYAAHMVPLKPIAKTLVRRVEPIIQGQLGLS